MSLDPDTAATVAEGLAATDPVDPHLWVDPALRVERDADDPYSVANPNGEDLSDVDPDAGDIIDLTALPPS